MWPKCKLFWKQTLSTRVFIRQFLQLMEDLCSDCKNYVTYHTGECFGRIAARWRDIPQDSHWEVNRSVLMEYHQFLREHLAFGSWLPLLLPLAHISDGISHVLYETAEAFLLPLISFLSPALFIATITNNFQWFAGCRSEGSISARCVSFNY